MSINRIRLEFKGLSSACPAAVMSVLIESDWNLKCKLIPKRIEGGVVLIESDWNLKTVLIILLTLAIAY